MALVLFDKGFIISGVGWINFGGIPVLGSAL
jgi:hypothetical protein